MFDTIQESFTNLIDKFKGLKRLTKSDIDRLLINLSEILIESDVSIQIVDDIINDFRSQINKEGLTSKVLNPEQIFSKYIYKSIEKTLSSSPKPSGFIFGNKKPSVTLLIGLQGSGKTTTSIKLAKHLCKNNKKILLCSLDLYRPAAIDQLIQFAKANNLDSFKFNIDNYKKNSHGVISVAKEAYEYAIINNYDAIIYDTAGRLHIDDLLMTELQEIYNKFVPSEVLLIVDSMLGQDAYNSISKFSNTINITGIILTKIDSSTKAGVAISAVKISNSPIKFMCTGEKSEDIEKFDAGRIAKRIMGMGDILGIIEKLEEKADKEKLEASLKNKFTLNELVLYLDQMEKMGGSKAILSKLPMQFKKLPHVNNSILHDNEIKKTKAIINSMTMYERINPLNLNTTRKRRITKGSGTTMDDFKKLLKLYEIQKDLMNKINTMNPMQLLNNAKNLFGF